MIVAIEGIDGAGKHTLVQALLRRVHAQGGAVTTLSFPRYSTSVHAQLAADALHGTMGDLCDSAHGMATMFALDRAGALDELRAGAAGNDLLLLDRYVASNAAYTCARLRSEEPAAWVAQLEFERLGLPRPSLQVLLDTPVDLAKQRAQQRGEADASRTLDAYERDASLQERTAQAYRRLAQDSWESPWLVAHPEQRPEEVAEAIVGKLGKDWLR